MTVADPSKLVGDLIKIQGVFYEKSEYKSGPKAGKVGYEQFNNSKWCTRVFQFISNFTFCTVLADSEFFTEISYEELQKRSREYFEMLDEDSDQLVGFFDFLQPILSILPSEVAATFQQD